MNTSIRKHRRRSRKLSKKQLYAVAVVALTVVSLLAVYSLYNQSNDGFKAAIIDQLSSNEDYVNATFVKTATDMLTVAGYQVTYYKGSDVTVDFYRSLPQNGYKILIFRVHSALYNGTSAPLDFFTSELYDHNAYVADQIANRLDIAMYQQGGEKYFGILSGFVKNAMWGNFQNATIILMGCNGLDGQGRSQMMLDALVKNKGAKVVIGWNASVSVNRTDIATEKLLHYLLVENKTVKDAVVLTNSEVAPDTYPNYPNELRYYPLDVYNYTIPHGPSKAVAAGMNVSDIFFLWGGIIIWPLLLPVKERARKV